ncbi:MAG: hypothetical protein ACXABY_27770 [Candidatus Thorarchaeota archaeon]|jgi:hypothetical protein
MIFPVRVYTPDGMLKEEIPVENLSRIHWSKFKKENRKNLKFGEKTEIQKYLAMQRIIDEHSNTKDE